MLELCIPGGSFFETSSIVFNGGLEHRRASKLDLATSAPIVKCLLCQEFLEEADLGMESEMSNSEVRTRQRSMAEST